MTLPSVILAPTSWHVDRALLFANNIANTTQLQAYYLFMGRHVPVPNNGIQVIADDVHDVEYDTYRNMIAGKRIKTADACLVIPNYPWSSNTFAMYDDSDINLWTEPFYCVVNAGSFYHVFKCLDNNQNTISTVAPNFADIVGTTISMRTSDGYVWKYMFSSAQTAVSQFGSVKYFPVSANAFVQAGAIPGAMDEIHVDLPGGGYGNYLNGTFGTGDVRVNGNTTLYQLGGNPMVVTTNGYYTGCLLYISGGIGAGQFATMTDYICNGNGNFAVINVAFSTAPQNGSTYQINPGIQIIGDGAQSVNAVARAHVNAIGNTISSVEMMQLGAGYSYANAAVVANAVVGITNMAFVRAIHSPPGGHGSDPWRELGAKYVTLSPFLANTEGNTIPANNQYQQVGILHNPVFGAATINLANNIGLFGTSEQMVVISNNILINLNVATNTASFIITGPAVGLGPNPGSVVVIQSSDGSRSQLANVVSIVNSTAVSLNATPLFSNGGGALMYLVFPGSTAVVTNTIQANSIVTANIVGEILTNDFVIGNQTGAIGFVTTIFRSGIAKTFDTFVQLYAWSGTVTSGALTQNEQVYEGANLATSTANAAVHSVVTVSGNSVIVYTSNQVGEFVAQMVGANSGAVIQVSSFNPPEVIFGTGDIMYVQNINPVPRMGNQTENFALTFDF